MNKVLGRGKMGKHHKRHTIPVIHECGLAIRSLTPTYHMVDFMRAGQRVRKGFDDIEDAKRFCQMRANEIKNEGTRTLSLPEKVRAEALRAMEILKNSGVSLVTAAEEYVRRHPTLTTEPIRETCDKYLAAMQKEERRPLSIYEKKLKFKALCAAMGDTPTAALDDSDIEEWAHARNVSNLTKNAYMGAARDLLLFYRRGGKLKPRRHCDEKPPITWDVRTISRIMTAAELKAPGIVPALSVLFFAGLRPYEMLRLTWEQIDLVAGVIRLTGEETKTRTMRNVEISENLRAWLTAYHNAGQLAPLPNQYRVQRKQVMVACSLSEWPNDVARHTYATAHYNAHHDAARTMAQLGHFGSPQMFLTHYKGVPMSATDATAYWKIVPKTQKGAQKIVPFARAAG